MSLEQKASGQNDARRMLQEAAFRTAFCTKQQASSLRAGETSGFTAASHDVFVPDRASVAFFHLALAGFSSSAVSSAIHTAVAATKADLHDC